VLIGMMGAGKTTVGSRLARALDRPFVDSDVQVEQRTARTVREIFETDGEAAYRQIEGEVLAEALASEEPAVIAAAGGTILDPANRRRMREHGMVVFLEADPADLVGRVGGQDHRPLLKDDPAGVLRQMDRDRRALYEETAEHTVDVSKLQPDEVVAQILELL
jgi:shikimate kinase